MLRAKSKVQELAICTRLLGRTGESGKGDIRDAGWFRGILYDVLTDRLALDILKSRHGKMIFVIEPRA